MYFKLRKDAKNWFSDISKSFSIDFDIYYFCLMAGFAEGRLERDGGDKSSDLVDYFPGEYRSRGDLLLAQLIRQELRRFKIKLDNQSGVRKKIGELILAKSPSCLTDEGVKLMNAYASGGYEVLLEYFDDRPRTVETFIRNYHKCLNKIVNKSN